MKICVTSQKNSLDSQVDPRFGRCQYFILIEPDNLEFEAVNNEAGSATGGAGIQSGQLMAEKKIHAVLTGNMGPNAFQVLKAAGVQVYTGVSGTVREAVEQFKNGELKPMSGPSVDQKFGMG